MQQFLNIYLERIKAKQEIDTLADITNSNQTNYLLQSLSKQISSSDSEIKLLLEKQISISEALLIEAQKQTRLLNLLSIPQPSSFMTPPNTDSLSASENEIVAAKALAPRRILSSSNTLTMITQSYDQDSLFEDSFIFKSPSQK